MTDVRDILDKGLNCPIVDIGRYAGQYAKPRTAAPETRDGVTCPSFKDDMIIALAANHQDRTPDPRCLFEAYAVEQD